MTQSSYSFILVKGGSFSRIFKFEQDLIGTPTDLTGKAPRFLVKFGGSTLEWTIAGGQVIVLSPATDGRIRLSLTVGQIEGLTFKAANYFLFLNEADDLILQGTIQVK